MSKSKTHCLVQMLYIIETENGASSYRLSEVADRSVKSVTNLLRPLVLRGELVVSEVPVRTYFLIDMEATE